MMTAASQIKINSKITADWTSNVCFKVNLSFDHITFRNATFARSSCDSRYECARQILPFKFNEF